MVTMKRRKIGYSHSGPAGNRLSPGLCLVLAIFVLATEARGDDVPVITDGVASPSLSHESAPHHANGTDDDHHGNKSHHSEDGGHGHHNKGLTVADLNYHEVRDPLVLTIVVLVAALSKIGYHHANFLSSKIPESCILIILGTAFGALVHFSGIADDLPKFFQPHEFFMFLLPPIILEAAFSLYDRTFLENIGSVLLFAVVGTILACIMLGGTLFGLAKAGAMGDIVDLSFTEIMVFSSLIVAVDPVAVLAVFNEIGVNHVLYFLVFGESLLNDGVTVVLYKVFQAYNVMDEINGIHYFLGILKFFVVCIGGLALGVLSGLLTAVMTKYSTHVKVAQPIIVFTMVYFGFLMAELFGFSGIISIIGCGLTQVHYAFANISSKSRTTIKYFTKVISSCNEIIIFLFLGLSMVNDTHVWHTGFTLWTIFFCLAFRFVIIFAMSSLINWLDVYRVRKIGFQEQYMIAYGGLRGAVCFSLVALLDPKDIPAKNMFVTTTLAVIIFTVFVQGITIKPFVSLLQIKLAPEKLNTMYKELTEHVNDHLMAGVEDIIGDHGRYHLREKFEIVDNKYLRPFLQVEPDPRDASLKLFYENLLLKEHYKYLKLSGAKSVGEIPELKYPHISKIFGPHVNTEMFLSSLDKCDPDEPALVKTPTIIEPSTPASVPPVDIETGGVELRRRGRGSRSVSFAPPSGLIDVHGLRGLLKSHRHSRMMLSKYDKNLTDHEGNVVQTEIRKKSHRNNRLLRLFSEDGASPGTERRKSWSEQDCQLAEQRAHNTTKPKPRHAMTVDFGNAGRQGVVNPLEGSGATPGVDAGFSPISPFTPGSALDSVFEEEEEATKNDERRPMLAKDEEDGEEKRIVRGGTNKSGKHRLERQLGLDTQMSGGDGKSGSLHGQNELEQNIPMKDLTSDFKAAAAPETPAPGGGEVEIKSGGGKSKDSTDKDDVPKV
ncbi:sodium/hydrogen exchanger 2 [Aplysia californica]|uniref:Sodium/hydrogen exchanger n=1 Tax=Aplysia californica TaxID=6500 RepID=A0ABM1W1E6_APLCA|nr:sodium/hydrogen exchanger 2 [Aplysia californica]